MQGCQSASLLVTEVRESVNNLLANDRLLPARAAALKVQLGTRKVRCPLCRAPPYVLERISGERSRVNCMQRSRQGPPTLPQGPNAGWAPDV